MSKSVQYKVEVHNVKYNIYDREAINYCLEEGLVQTEMHNYGYVN